MPNRSKRTKVVCTIGPASSTPEALRALMQAGLDVARINFSHGTHAQHAARITDIRRIASELNRPVAILGDLQGPRIRVGNLEQPVQLEEGAELTLAHESVARPGDLPVTYDGLAKDVHAGARILLDDGLLALDVLAVEGDFVHCRVVYGGLLKSHKGMNLPGVQVSAPTLTEKDLVDIAFAVEHNLDYLALSFVRRPSDLAELRALVPKGVLLVSKIEKDSALLDIEEILKASDAVMVARGDLGVELPFEEVPIAQKRIIALANRFGRPVITATQMLESMITNPRPTRAEASDVANAIFDGTDAVMLSAETASGAYPKLAVEAMVRIACEAERHPVPRGVGADRVEPGQASVEETIAGATATAVRMLGAAAIVVFTKSGFAARIVAARRPGVPIVAMTDQARTYRQLALVWGVTPVLVPHADTYEQMAWSARGIVVDIGIAKPGDRVVMTAGVPFDVPGTTNTLKVETV
ncbi:MAG: pyruvate kinase [Gemmatimonadota bacterium]|nr:pyruvate kinase [Gemmatimonadota bacterium]